MVRMYMVKKIILSVAILVIPSMVMSQKRLWRFFDNAANYLQNTQIVTDTKPFQHIDVAVTGGTSGFGFDLATPLWKWGQLRVGGVFRPFRTYGATFSLNMGDEEIGEKINIPNERFDMMSNMMYSFTNTYPDKRVTMLGDLKMNDFKMLVDVFPVKKHRNFHVTVGFYYGNGTLISANVKQEYLKTLAAVNTFNTMYKRALGKESLMDIEGIASDAGITLDGSLVFSSTIERLRRWGRINTEIVRSVDDGNGNITYYDANDMVVKTVNRYADFLPDEYVTNTRYSMTGANVGMGKYSRDVIAEEDVYYDYSVELDNPYYVTDASDPSGYREERYVRDENGTEIKKGNIHYHKGDVIYKAGDDVRLVPDEDNMIITEGKTNKFKPYVGVGYTLPVTKDKKLCVSVDAGVWIWGGHPKVEVSQPIGVDISGNTLYHTIDLTRDVNSLPRKVETYVGKIRSYPVFPEVSLRISRRLW